MVDKLLTNFFMFFFGVRESLCLFGSFGFLELALSGGKKPNVPMCVGKIIFSVRGQKF